MYTDILNLTGKPATDAQQERGVCDFLNHSLQWLKSLIEWESEPSKWDAFEDSESIADFADEMGNEIGDVTEVMIDCPNEYKIPLVKVLNEHGFIVYNTKMEVM